VADAGSSKKKARHAAAAVVIAEMLKMSEQVDQMQKLTLNDSE